MGDAKDEAWAALMDAARRVVEAKEDGGVRQEDIGALLAAGQRAALLAVASALEERQRCKE